MFRWIGLILLLYLTYRYISYLMRLSKKRQTVPPQQDNNARVHQRRETNNGSNNTKRGTIQQDDGEYIDYEEIK